MDDIDTNFMALGFENTEPISLLDFDADKKSVFGCATYTFHFQSIAELIRALKRYAKDGPPYGREDDHLSLGARILVE